MAANQQQVRQLAELVAAADRVFALTGAGISTESGISDFRNMLKQVEEHTPLRRNVTIEEVGNTAAFLCSDLASGITGDVVYVDTGFHILGMG